MAEEYVDSRCLRDWSSRDTTRLLTIPVCFQARPAVPKQCELGPEGTLLRSPGLQIDKQFISRIGVLRRTPRLRMVAETMWTSTYLPRYTKSKTQGSRDHIDGQPGWPATAAPIQGVHVPDYCNRCCYTAQSTITTTTPSLLLFNHSSHLNPTLASPLTPSRPSTFPHQSDRHSPNSV